MNALSIHRGLASAVYGVLVITLGCSGSTGSSEPVGTGGSGGISTGGTAGELSFAGEAGTAGLGNSNGTGAAGAANVGTAGAANGIGGSAGFGGRSGLGGASSGAGVSGIAGTSAAPVDRVFQWVESGPASPLTSVRPDFGGLVVANDAHRSYVVESRREVADGPLGLPWRTRFRLAAYERGALLWAFVVDPDDLIGDVVVHPSGDITVAWEQYAPEVAAYRLVRLGPNGTPKGVTELLPPASIPVSDFGPAETPPLLRMKSPLADATTAGWLRLSAYGENIGAAILSFVDTKVQGSWSNQLAMAIAVLEWNSSDSAYLERWARLVEGTHAASPAAWAYDELRWREQAVRPFLSHDATSHEWIVGRAWNSTRCNANRLVFAEFTAAECVLDAVNLLENERLPLAITRFSESGARLGTRILTPEPDAAEQVPFALAARDGLAYVAGSIVRTHADGAKRTYPDAGGFVDYDGYFAVYSREGSRLAIRDVNLGRGDVLASIRGTVGGFVAVGSSNWDRWQGGMSISRGSDPLIAFATSDTSAMTARTVVLGDGTRHFGLHDVAVFDDSVVGFGFADAPMTHSADQDSSARTFAGLQLTLAPSALP